MWWIEYEVNLSLNIAYCWLCLNPIQSFFIYKKIVKTWDSCWFIIYHYPVCWPKVNSQRSVSNISVSDGKAAYSAAPVISSVHLEKCMCILDIGMSGQTSERNQRGRICIWMSFLLSINPYFINSPILSFQSVSFFFL